MPDVMKAAAIWPQNPAKPFITAISPSWQHKEEFAQPGCAFYSAHPSQPDQLSS